MTTEKDYEKIKNLEIEHRSNLEESSLKHDKDMGRVHIHKCKSIFQNEIKITYMYFFYERIHIVMTTAYMLFL